MIKGNTQGDGAIVRKPGRFICLCLLICLFRAAVFSDRVFDF
ncbi:hypothetical protein HMPREF9449_00674 [Odoribacter laneus YIT 12061]|uniref:Uncharacterized protein n=1 Tax=Odoribacter laneus YIT 12061 TaxID=742817 RepID=H1DEI8_9BACT|nr:hypothetical protein HMPREF9449_00674 [Odoribacter laneus YIT 12061]